MIEFTGFELAALILAFGTAFYLFMKALE